MENIKPKNGLLKTFGAKADNYGKTIGINLVKALDKSTVIKIIEEAETYLNTLKEEYDSLLDKTEKWEDRIEILTSELHSEEKVAEFFDIMYKRARKGKFRNPVVYSEFIYRLKKLQENSKTEIADFFKGMIEALENEDSRKIIEGRVTLR